MSSHHSSTEVELSVAVRNLKTNDDTSSTNPKCVLFNQPFGRSWQEYARTETQKDTRNPNFHYKIKIPYCFEEQQPLKFQLFNAETNTPSLSKHIYLGKVECTLAQIVSHYMYSANIMLNGKIRGRLCVSVEEIGRIRDEVELVFSATHLRRNNLPFFQPDPFLEIVSSNKTLLRRTTWMSSTKNPTWPSIYMPLRSLKNDRTDSQRLSLLCFHHSKDSEHHLLGETEVKPRELLQAPNKFILKKHANSVRGELHLVSSQVRSVHSFIDFISSGTKLHCTFAIDFTEANGDARSLDSLHHLGSKPTMYEYVLRTFSEIFQDYEGATLSLMGFGAQSAPIMHELHVDDASGIVQAYRNCLHTIRFGDTSCFAPSIEHMAHIAKDHTSGDDYYILVILTCGEISDLNKTTKAIVEASELPVSVVIVGIGEAAEFATISLMLSEVKKLSHHGHHATRENIQFCRFKEYLDKYDEALSSFHLAKYLLADIPHQLETYMKIRGLLPKNKRIIPSVN